MAKAPTLEELQAQMEELQKQMAAAQAQEASKAPAQPKRRRPAAKAKARPKQSTRAKAAAAAKQPAAAKLPFPRFAEIRSSERTLTRQILRDCTPAQLTAGRKFEVAHDNRTVVVGLFDDAIRRTNGASAAAPAKPAASKSRARKAPVSRRQATAKVLDAASADGLPLPGYDKVASSRKTESRAILAAASAEQLQAALPYEKANENRVQIIRMIETQLRKKQQAAPAKAAANAKTPAPAKAKAADKRPLPFRGFGSIVTTDRTGMRRLFRKQTREGLIAALDYEKAGDDRRTVIRLLTEAVEQKDKAAAPKAAPAAASKAKAAPAAAKQSVPWSGYGKLMSSKRTEARRAAKGKSREQLTAAVAYEKAGQNRKSLIDIFQAALDKTSPAATKDSSQARSPGRPSLAERPSEFVGKPPLAEYVTWSLTASEPERNTRTRISGLTDAKLVKALIDFESAQPKPRSIILNLLTRKHRALTGVGASGRPYASTCPVELLPFPGYRDVKSSEQTAGRAILQPQSLDVLEKTLAFEREHDQRVQVLDMIEYAIRKNKAEAMPLPFPDYAKIASSRQREAKEILRSPKRTVKQLQDALVYEAELGKRVQIIRLTEDALRRKGVEPEQATTPAPAAAPAADELPLPGYDKVASSRKTESRAILAKATVKQLQTAIPYEQSHQNRVQIIRMIETQLRKRQTDAQPAATKAPAAAKPAAAPEPFEGFNDIVTTDRTGMRRLFRKQTRDGLADALKIEKAGQARKTVTRLLSEAIEQKDKQAAGSTADWPEAKVTPAAGKAPVAAEPFPGFGSIVTTDRTGMRRLFRKQTREGLASALEAEIGSLNRKTVVRLLGEAIEQKDKQAAPAPAAAAEPFEGFNDIVTTDRTGMRRLFRKQTRDGLAEALKIEQAGQARKTVVRLLGEAIEQKDKQAAADAQPAPAAADQAPAFLTDELPFPGYDQVASSRKTESRALLIGQDVDTLQRCLIYEQAHENRVQIKAMIERIISQKSSGQAPASRLTDTEPLPNYDALPTKTVVQSVKDGVVDASLSAILAYEQAHGGRRDVIAAVQSRQQVPRAEGKIVSPNGREWQGKEPWMGYGSMDHNDEETLLVQFRMRSVSELRRVPDAESRQAFPSQTAIDAARVVVSEITGQPVAA